MSKQVIMPQEDWQDILDAVRYSTEDGALLRSGEVASKVRGVSESLEALVNGSADHLKNSHLTIIKRYAFMSHTNLKSIVLPNVTQVGQSGFRECANLVKADFSSLNLLENYAFYSSSAIKTLIIRTNTVCTLVNRYVFVGSPMNGGDGYIYVPSALLAQYKQATNWSVYADHIRAIEDYPEITGETI